MKSCPRYELVSKIEQFSKRVFFASDWTFGHVEASFDRSNEMFMAEGQKLFTQYPKTLKKLTNFSISDVFSSKRSDGNIECSFENRWKKVDKRLKKLARSPNLIKDQNSSVKIFFLKTVLLTDRKQFSQLYQVFFGKKPKNLLIFRNC